MSLKLTIADASEPDTEVRFALEPGDDNEVQVTATENNRRWYIGTFRVTVDRIMFERYASLDPAVFNVETKNNNKITTT